MARLRKDNRSGYPGVSWSKEKQRWHAKIGWNYKRIHIGYWNDPEDAYRAYKKTKRKLEKGEMQ